MSVPPYPPPPYRLSDYPSSRTVSPSSASASASASSSSSPSSSSRSGALLSPALTVALPTEPSMDSTAPISFDPLSAAAVVGCDFGTSRTGFGHQFRVNKDDPVIIANQPPFSGLKTPTDVLISLHDERVVLFGSSAHKEYMELDDDARRSYVFFRRFKMCLYGDALSSRPMIRSSSGVQWEAVRVFAACLRFIKVKALLVLQEASPAFKLTANDVYWLLTVPAIWSDEAKQLMRDAALRAGMISHASSQQLLLVLEPEAASIRCREVSQRLLDANRRFPLGTTYILLDAGGGTLDCVIHRITGDGSQISEVEKSSGQNLGSTNIDRAFEGLLHRIFAEECVRQYATQLPTDYLEMLDSWELLKLDVKGSRHGQPPAIPFNYRLPPSFIEWIENWPEAGKGKRLQQRLDAFNRLESFPTIRPWRKGFQLSYEAMLALFSPTLDGIVRHAMDLQSRCKDAAYVFLVGGLGECDLLFERLEDAMEANVNQVPVPPRVLRPEKGSLAVLAGAIRWGLQPPSIVRRMRFGYGVGLMTLWTEKHRLAGRTRQAMRSRGNTMWHTEVYCSLVRVSEAVPPDQVVETSAAALDDSTTVALTLYKTALADPQYVDLPGVIPLGTVTVRVGEHVKATDRNLRVRVRFGGTELQVWWMHCESGREEQLRIDMVTDRVV